MQLHDVEQKSEEWNNLRLGKITASEFHKLCDVGKAKKKSKNKKTGESANENDKPNKIGKACEDYLYARAAEILTKQMSDADQVLSIRTPVAVARGNEWEETARNKYITATFSAVTHIGIVELDDYTACSPDGLVGDDGLIEIKILDSHTFLKNRLQIYQKGIEAIDKDHYWQMQFCMYVCDRKWCDYVLYNPKHEVNGKDLFITRVERDETAQERIKNILAESIKQIKTYIDQYLAI